MLVQIVQELTSLKVYRHVTNQLCYKRLTTIPLAKYSQGRGIADEPVKIHMKCQQDTHTELKKKGSIVSTQINM